MLILELFVCLVFLLLYLEKSPTSYDATELSRLIIDDSEMTFENELEEEEEDDDLPTPWFLQPDTRSRVALQGVMVLMPRATRYLR